MSLTAIILTHNDCQKALKSLDSVLFADKIIIIDDFSTDKDFNLLQDFSRKYPDKITLFQRNLHGDFASQRNFGLQKAETDWILYVDSDEIIGTNLCNEILEAIKAVDIDGYLLKREDIFMGKKLKHGEISALSFLRLAKKGSGEWQGKVHETWNISGKIRELKFPLLHKHDLSISQFLQRLDIYSSIRAKFLYEQKVKEGFWLLFLKPCAKFWQNYIFRLGFLDGFAGLTMAWLMSWHSFLVRLKLQILWLNRGSLTFLPNNNDQGK